MDAAEATSPKQTARFLSERVNPVLKNFQSEFRSTMGKMDEILSGLLNEAKLAGETFKAAYGDAAFVAREHKRRSRNLLIATAAIGFSVVTISLLSAWVFHGQFMRSEWGCEAVGGIHKVSFADGVQRFCILGAG